MGTVSFPGLGLEFELTREAFRVPGIDWPVYWYGIIIAAGFLLAVLYCSRRAHEFGIKPDDIIDMLFFAVPLAILGARLYYILFYLDRYRTADGGLDFGAMVRIWDGGLAIYGGVIAAALTLLVFCKVRKIKFLAFADLGVFGLLIGQLVGRWGNFVNIECYGGPTDLPWRMGIYERVGDAVQYVEVHPTFLYESLWNLLGLLVLWWVSKRWRKFDGQMFLSYFAWYGVGRAFIEGMRTDSLYFFNTPIRVSQMVGILTAAVAIVLLIVELGFRRHGLDALYVNQLQLKGERRRTALVYLEGSASQAWVRRQKKTLESAGRCLEEYALPPETSQEEIGELIAALRGREDLDQVLTHLEGEASGEAKPPSSAGETAPGSGEEAPREEVPETEDPKEETPAEKPPQE